MSGKFRDSGGIENSHREPSPSEKQQNGFAGENVPVDFARQNGSSDGRQGNDISHWEVIGETIRESMRIENRHPVPHQNPEVRVQEAQRNRTEDDRQHEDIAHLLATPSRLVFLSTKLQGAARVGQVFRWIRAPQELEMQMEAKRGLGFLLSKLNAPEPMKVCSGSIQATGRRDGGAVAALSGDGRRPCTIVLRSAKGIGEVQHRLT